MREVYTAETIVDAHLVAGWLHSHGMAAFVAGDYLAGGMGMLPVSGLIRVLVDDHDVVAAQTLIAEFKRAEHAPSPSPSPSPSQDDPQLGGQFA
jgi:hypothetical protein